MLEVYTYNAGKGDCIRLHFAGTHNIFIDSGVSRFAPSFQRICNQIKQSRETLDVMVLTHVDDDLDIGMLREDYNRFLRVCENELRPGFFLQTHKTEPMSPFYFSKMRLDGTKFVEKYVRYLKIHQGIFLDIFPYDNIPDNRWAEIIQRLKVDFLSQLVIARRVCGTSVELGPFKKVFAPMYRCVFRAASFLMNMDKVISLIDRESTKYNNMKTQCVSYVRLPFLKMKSEWIDSFVYYQFENTQIPCPQGVNLYLRNHFGNYMQMPAEKKRVGHSPFVLDLGRRANMLSPTDRTTTETE